MSLRYLVITAAVAAFPFAASALTLDDFSVDQLVGDDEFEGVVNTNVTTDTLFERTMFVSNRLDDSPLSAELKSGFLNDLLEFSNDPTVEGVAEVSYAVGATDLTLIGTAFEIDLVSFDLTDKDADFIITINGSDSVSRTFDIEDVGTSLTFAFSSFIDLTAVSTLSLTIDAADAPALDVAFDNFRLAPVPVPAAGLLLLGGLGALGAMRRKKKKAV